MVKLTQNKYIHSTGSGSDLALETVVSSVDCWAVNQQSKVTLSVVKQNTEKVKYRGSD